MDLLPQAGSTALRLLAIGAVLPAAAVLGCPLRPQPPDLRRVGVEQLRDQPDEVIGVALVDPRLARGLPGGELAPHQRERDDRFAVGAADALVAMEDSHA